MGKNPGESSYLHLTHFPQKRNNNNNKNKNKSADIAGNQKHFLCQFE